MSEKTQNKARGKRNRRDHDVEEQKTNTNKRVKQQEQDEVEDSLVVYQGKQEKGDKIEKFKTGYGSSALSSYDTFVWHLGSWKKPLQEYLSHPQFKSIFDFVKHEYDIGTWFPPKNLIFNAFQLTPFNDLKVVLIGLDPFENKDEAMGLAYSVSRNSNCPVATQNIFKALENDSKLDFKPPVPLHGDLRNWAKQGILMLNNWLTVREGASYSHSKAGWSKFTKAVLNAINKEKEGIVFLCWGKQSANICKNIDTKRHHVLTYGSPSQSSQKHQKFENCKNFSKVNEILEEEGLSKINWSLK